MEGIHDYCTIGILLLAVVFIVVLIMTRRSNEVVYVSTAPTASGYDKLAPHVSKKAVAKSLS